MSTNYQSTIDTIIKKIDSLSKQLAQLESKKPKRGKGRRIAWRRNKRRLKKSIRFERDRLKKLETRSYKAQVKDDKREDREDRISIRQTAKTQRNFNRMDARKVAYANGFDPLSRQLGGISGIIGSAGSAVSSIYGQANNANLIKQGINPSPLANLLNNPSLSGLFGGNNTNNPTVNNQNNNVIYIVIGAVVLLVVMFLKKK